MDSEDVRRCIHSLWQEDRTPDAQLIAARIGVPISHVRLLLKSDKALNAYLIEIRATIRAQRRSRVAKERQATAKPGGYTPYWEPQNLAGDNKGDMAKNEKYWRDTGE